MASKILVFSFVFCISLFVVTGGTQQDEKSSKDINTEKDSLSSEEPVHAEGRNSRSTRDIETNSQKQISNNFRKAEEQEQKLNLELAIETTRLEELNKLKQDEKIDDTTPSDKLSKWQKNLLNYISKTTKKKNELTVKAATSKTLVDQLKQQLSTGGTSPTTTIKDNNQIKDKTSKIIRALEDQNKKTLELALATTKLEELQKQKEAEKIDESTAPSKLTKWQKNLLNDITKAKEKKGDLTVEVAVIKTKVEQLKQQLTAAGGSADSITSTSSKSQKEINGKLQKAEENQWKISKNLELAKTELEQLEKQKEAEKITTESTNLTNKQKTLLNNIEKAKEKKYNLSVKDALEKTLIDQLKHQLNSSAKPSSSGSTTTK